MGEIQKGIDQLGASDRRDFLIRWLEEHILPLYSERLFFLDLPIARTWGALSADLKRRGSMMQVTDAIIAATAITHQLTLVTRNEKHFSASGVQVLNPWN